MECGWEQKYAQSIKLFMTRLGSGWGQEPETEMKNPFNQLFKTSI